MILYFADRQLNIIGQASTKLPKGLTIVDDNKTEDVESGVAVFECKIPFTKDTRSEVEECTELGNHIIMKDDDEDKLYTITDAEIDTKAQEVYIYAEDDGMDLLNEVVGAYEADKAYDIAHYINKYAADAGFVIGINEVSSLTRKLSWDGESTATARIASVATQFDGCEISFSFEIDGLNVTKKYINIHKERGKDIGVTLRLNKDIDRIITTKSIANLATALQCTGGTPEDDNFEDDVDPVPVTLKGYSYDDGDFYVDSDGLLKSRKALEKWSRFLWKTDESALSGGHIVKQYSYDTLDQKTLCSHAITELKKICDMEVNYEADISDFPDSVKAGDRINIVDDAGELYLSTRVLKLESSETNKEKKATFGEYLIKTSGISQKVAELAAQFAKAAQSAARALAIANNAKAKADAAQVQADTALAGSNAAQEAAEAAQTAANSANESALLAQEKAAQAQEAVDVVEESVASLETTVDNVQKAADNAQQAADTAQQKADEAAQAAAQAKADAADAQAAVEVAQSTAETAVEKANTAQTTADTAKSNAATAQATAEAAKLDAEKANQDIASLGDELETVSQTMEADFARKTDLTETEASLQSQISQNAAQISSTVTKVQEIDETANNAQEQAQAAQSAADAAQAKADQATVDAQAAQTAADQAAQAAQNAQSEADTAKAAAATAQSVADKAQEDLEAAQAELATVTSRVDATEEEITAAQQAVTAAQTAADNAQAEADAAAKKAAEAQTTANTAVSDAANAQTAANDAASAAALAQKTADEAKGDASAAQTKADEAATAAAEAQRTADAAVTNAANAQAKADQAAADAATAQQAADDADAKAAQAAADLATAQQNLADVTSRVGATEEEVEAAKQAVNTAQAAADKAKEEAEAAQATADTAKANAATAQTAADNAKTAADNAQAAADDAQKAADDAQAAVDALAVRVTTAETKITQNSEEIALRATKTEVAETLGGYYTKTEADAAISVKANEITQNVSATYTTKEDFNKLKIGGRNLLPFNKIQYADATLLEGTSTEYLKLSCSGQYKGIYIPGELFESDTEYVLSYDMTLLSGDGSVGAHCGIAETSEMYLDGVYVGAYGDAVSLAQNTKLHVEVRFRTKATTTDSIYIQAQRGNSSPITMEHVIENLKVEKGNKATDWTPAPEDLEERVTNVESSITQQAEAIELRVTKTEVAETLGSYYTKSETDAAIDSLEMYGHNLVLNSGVEHSNNNYVVATYTPSAPLEQGETYTLSLCFTPASGVTGIMMGIAQGWSTPATISASGTGKQIGSQTFVANYNGQLPTANIANADIHLYRLPNDGTVTGDTTIHWIKVEKGSKATDYTAAPEDEAIKRFEALEVGGRNLVLNADFSAVSNVSNDIGTQIPEPTTRTLTFNPSATGGVLTAGMVFSDYALKNFRGAQIISSIEFMKTAEIELGTTNPFIGYEWCLKRDDTTGGSDGYYSVNFAEQIAAAEVGQWVKHTATKTESDYDVASLGYFMIIARDFIGEIKFRNFKVEFGNKATDWTPAPEDLEERVTNAETAITQNAEAIELRATKAEVAETLGGYYTKDETEAAIKLESDSITSEVSSTYSTNERMTAAESIIQQLSTSIATLIRDENGESLMTQTEDGWSFSMKETNEAVSGLSSAIETLQEESGSTQATVAAMQQALNDHAETLEYVTITTYEDEPCIELGESDSEFKLLITNTRIMFMNGSNVPTYINTNGLVTQNIEVKGNIIQGGYTMMNTSDGGWGLLWIGVSS